MGDAAPPDVHVPAVLPHGGVGAGVDLSGDGATAPPLLLDHWHRILLHRCMYPLHNINKLEHTSRKMIPFKIPLIITKLYVGKFVISQKPFLVYYMAI